MKTDNIDEVCQSLDRIANGILEAAAEAKKDVAAEVFKGVAKRSPVWSGPYVKSHRIGIGKIDKRSAKPAIGIDGKLPPKMPEAEAEALKSEIAEWETGILKRKKVDLEKPIYISNSIGHARNVEYIGFQSMTQPYRVYGLTYQEVLAKLHNLVKISLSENAVMRKK